MTNTTFMTAAAARPRTLSTLTSPFAVPMSGDSWLAHHNSITANVPAVVTTGYGAAKQAAPPRGVPR